jgi:hypothetical protein
MRHFWRAAFAVAIAGFALVATVDVRLAYADEQPRVIHTLCGQGILNVCGEDIQYHCPSGGSIGYTYPYTIGITITQPVCYPVSRTNKYKDFVSNTAPIIIRATGPRCTKTPSDGTEDEAGASYDGYSDGDGSDDGECTE